MVSTPSPPDPTKTAMGQLAVNQQTAGLQQNLNTKTAEEQSGLNKESAIAQSNLNSVNQVTPSGSLTYKTTGTNPDGTPIRTATTNLSPDEQNIYNLGQTTRSNIGQIGVDQSSRIGKLLGTPVNLSNDATEARLMELGHKRLDPVLAQRRSSTETDLINRGITPGTEAYDRAMRGVTQGENDAYSQLLLTGHGQGVQEALTERNQPINEITALQSGSQVSQPNFVNAPQSNVAATNLGGTNLGPIDYSGMVNSNYLAGVSQNNAMLGGLAGIAGTALGGWGKGGFAMPKFGTA